MYLIKNTCVLHTWYEQRYTPLSHFLCHYPFFILNCNLYYTFPKHSCTFYSGGFSSFPLHISSRNKVYPIWHRYNVNVTIPLNVRQCIPLHISHKNEKKLCIQIYNTTTNLIHVKFVSPHQINLRPMAAVIGPILESGYNIFCCN